MSTGSLVTLAGATFRQRELIATLERTQGAAFEVTIKAEPTNPHDPKALAVYDPHNDKLLGYIAKKDQEFFATVHDGGEPETAMCHIEYWSAKGLYLAKIARSS